MKKPEQIAKITDFVAVGDDSFIDDQGMTNRWAIRRRERMEAQRRAEQEQQQTTEDGYDDDLDTEWYQ